jgi:hypothetical protein
LDSTLPLPHSKPLPKLYGYNPAQNLLTTPRLLKGHKMPKSKKPRVKRADANPVKKPAAYQGLHNVARQEGSHPNKAGKKAVNKGA